MVHRKPMSFFSTSEVQFTMFQESRNSNFVTSYGKIHKKDSVVRFCKTYLFVDSWDLQIKVWGKLTREENKKNGGKREEEGQKEETFRRLRFWVWHLTVLNPFMLHTSHSPLVGLIHRTVLDEDVTDLRFDLGGKSNVVEEELGTRSQWRLVTTRA